MVENAASGPPLHTSESESLMGKSPGENQNSRTARLSAALLALGRESNDSLELTKVHSEVIEGDS